MLTSAFWHYSQCQKWQFLNSNIYVWHQGACSERGAQGRWLWTIFFLTRMLPCRNRLRFWKSHVHIMLTTKFPPSWTLILVWTLLRKWFNLHQELPVLKDVSTCNSVFPRPNIQHSSLEITVLSEANSPWTIVCLRKKYWTWLPISSCFPEAAIPIIYQSSWPLCSCVSRDLLCFSQCTSAWTRGVHGIKQPKLRLTTTNETPNYLWGNISSPRS